MCKANAQRGKGRQAHRSGAPQACPLTSDLGHCFSVISESLSSLRGQEGEKLLVSQVVSLRPADSLGSPTPHSELLAFCGDPGRWGGPWGHHLCFSQLVPHWGEQQG